MFWEWWERYRRLFLAVGAMLFFGSGIWWYLADRAEVSHEQTPVPFTPAAISPAAGAEDRPAAADSAAAARQEHAQREREPEPAPLYVDVKGKVKNPGVYRFETGRRVADAIEKAGGPLPEADLDQINLALPLQDGAAIVVPEKRSGPEGRDSPAPAGLQSVMPADLSGNQANSRVNLNTATKEELMKLPGIGEAKAEAILEHRENKRPFRSPEELKQVKGIGEKMYERLKDHIRVQ